MQNLVTQEQAGQNWCPFARAIIVGKTGQSMAHNRHMGVVDETPDAEGRVQLSMSDNPESCRCIGARCMAWSWWDALPEKPRSDDPQAVERFATQAMQMRGFCGLAK